uniref:Uncharacterized protein n=1 Tax=Angiostrongylus cantonensis TaxID=6313 RepID=A0A0K0D0U1_ANGCA
MVRTKFHQLCFQEFKLGCREAETAGNINEVWGESNLVSQQCEHDFGNCDLVISISTIENDVDVSMNLTTTN